MRLVPIQAMRVVLGLLGVFFAYSLGRAVTRLHRSRQPFRKALTWVLRTVVVVFAVLYTGGFDGVGIAVIALLALAFAGGVYLELRPRKDEEIHLFPQA